MNNEIPLILASASPRRKEILEAHGHYPIVMPADVDEDAEDESLFTPEGLTIHLAEMKAEAVLEKLKPADWPLGCLILGVDTIVYRDRVIGKPKDEADALGILRSLKSGVHEVISGVCMIRADARTEADGALDYDRARFSVSGKTLFSDTTFVRFGDYTDEEILAYVRANPPYDKSGSYAIQSEWGKHVLEMDGDIENVIGLPYKKLSAYLRLQVAGSTPARP